MKKLSYLFVLLTLQLAFAQQAQVTNVTAAQRTDGSKIVDITYDLTEDTLFTDFNVTVEVSFDAGATYNLTVYVTGAVGTGVVPGTGKEIEWNLGQEYNNTFDENVKVKVIATGHVAGEIPFEFVTVEAGDYTYGSDDQILNIDYDYQIMKYEVTNAEYTEFLIEAYATGEVWLSGGDVEGFYPGDGEYPGGNYELYDLGEPSDSYNYGRIDWNGTTFIVTEGYGGHPVIEVTWFGAYKFAEHYGLHLPDEYEWEKAARGNSGYDYPWGNSIDGSRANYSGSGDPWDNGTTPAGFYNGQTYEGFVTTDSPSQFGAYDMAGNVWEWTKSWYSEGSSYRVRRGGSWNDYAYYCQSWTRNYYNPDVSYSVVGFRCARTL